MNTEWRGTAVTYLKRPQMYAPAIVVGSPDRKTTRVLVYTSGGVLDETVGNGFLGNSSPADQEQHALAFRELREALEALDAY